MPVVTYPANEWVFGTLRTEVHKHTISTIERFQLKVAVSKVNTMVPELRTWDSESNTYRFKRWEHEEDLIVRLRFDPDGAYVEVRKESYSPWTPLAEYMDSLPRVDIHQVGSWGVEGMMAYRNRCQQDWWAGNEKTFDLRSLPLEIREVIYEHAMPKHVYPYRYSILRKNNYEFVRDGPNVALLRSNKNVYEECRPFLWSKAQFSFRERNEYTRFTRLVPAPRLHELSSIKLAFSHVDFLKFFGALLSDEHVYQAHRAAVALKSLPLKRLEIVMPHPARGEDCNWLNHHDRFCQKTVTDWILIFMRPHVAAHMPVLELSGCVTDTQKALFMSGGYQSSAYSVADEEQEEWDLARLARDLRAAIATRRAWWRMSGEAQGAGRKRRG